jgi:hypothetical protein
MNKDQGLGYRVASQHNKKRKNMFSLILPAACRYEFFFIRTVFFAHHLVTTLLLTTCAIWTTSSPIAAGFQEREILSSKKAM